MVARKKHKFDQKCGMNNKSSLFVDIAFVSIVVCLVLLVVDFAIFVSLFPFQQLVFVSWFLTFAILTCGLLLLVLSFRRKTLWEQRTHPAWYRISSVKVVRWSLALLCGVAVAFFITTIIVIYYDIINSNPSLALHYKGFVSDTEATLMWRYSNVTSIVIEYRAVNSTNTPWLVSEIKQVDSSTDYVTSIRLSNLTPSTTYLYRAVFNGNAYHTEFYNLTTMPPSGMPTTFTFVFGSCVFNKFSTSDRFGQMLQQRPNFALFLGDWIYSDRPWYSQDNVAYYHTQYRNVFHDPFIQQFVASVPSVWMWNDHEILDDWDQNTAPPYPSAAAAFTHYLATANPQPFRRGVFYFNFTVGTSAFFVFDTRTYRSESNTPELQKTMLGETQLNDFFLWLLDNKFATFKFVASSVPFTLNTVDPDTWYGFQYERQRILDFISSNNIDDVILLSGDRHWAGVFKIQKGIYEFSVSPIDAFSSSIFNTPQNIEEQLFYSNGQKYFGLVTVNEITNTVSVLIFGNNGPVVRFDLNATELVVN